MTGDSLHTGGCQCGAVRYAFSSDPVDPHLPLPHVPEGVWRVFRAARGRRATDLDLDARRARFSRAPTMTERGFARVAVRRSPSAMLACAWSTCGDRRLDDPRSPPGSKRIARASSLPWFGDLAALPSDRHRGRPRADTCKSGVKSPASDHDTADWPPGKSHEKTPLSLRHHAARRRADDGVDFSLEDKTAHRKTLDELGVDYIEGGYPGANVTDTAFFADEAHEAARSSPRSA